MLEFIPDEYKTQKMCEKAVGYVSEMLQLTLDQYKTQVMCYRAEGSNL